MKTRVDERLCAEVVRFRLKFTCPDCAYFDDVTERCSEGYPAEEHLSGDLDRAELIFCKLFEAGS
jgi:hypothetical protein